jgi:hypothetical protein
MPSNNLLSRLTTRTLLEHLIQNDVISEEDIYDDLNEEIADILFSAITLSLKENK